MFSRLFRREQPVPAGMRESYAQCGEDMIVSYLFDVNLGVAAPTYLDIGAHDASYLSNTYHFYRRGFSGVLVEPDPDLCAALAAVRTRDRCVNAGIGTRGESAAEFYVMDDRTLNTFSKAAVDGYLRHGHKVVRTTTVPLMTVAELVGQHCKSPPNFVSIDTEGFDLDILRSIDFGVFRPEAICVESMDHEHQTKGTAFTELLTAHDYVVHSDTYLNTIFVERRVWEGRRGLARAS